MLTINKSIWHLLLVCLDFLFNGQSSVYVYCTVWSDIKKLYKFHKNIAKAMVVDEDDTDVYIRGFQAIHDSCDDLVCLCSNESFVIVDTLVVL